jgi:integrase
MFAIIRDYGMGKSIGKNGGCMALTELGLKAIKPAATGTTLSDGGNLYGKVRAKAGGAVSVSFSYRYKQEGKQKEISCGTWPSVSLKNVRLARDQARALIEKGADPADRKKAEKLETRLADAERITTALQLIARMTVRQLFEKWLAGDLKGRKDQGSETERGFKKDVLPFIGDRFADSIKRIDIMEVLDRITHRGADRLANRVLSELRQMFGYAAIREWVTTDPTFGIKKAHVGGKETERERVLTPAEIRALPDALTDAGLLDSTKALMWLILSTTCRIGEAVKARKADIDTEQGTWRIPPDASKNEDAHLIFLSPFAIKYMEKLLMLSNSKIWLMPMRSDLDQHQDPKSIAKQIGDRQLKFAERVAHSKRSANENALAMGDDKWTPHDLRRTSATIMQSLGILPAVVEACLNHREENRMKRIYQRHDYSNEKREAWLKLGERLSVLLAGNVILGEFAKTA